MSDVVVEHYDHTHMRVVADSSIMMELVEVYTFLVPGYQFTPKFKFGQWDGKIRLLSAFTGLLYAGLFQHLKEYCEANGYSFEHSHEFNQVSFTKEALNERIGDLAIPTQFDQRDYQIDAILDCIQNSRRMMISPTASGKSFMIYVLLRFYRSLGLNILIVVPTTSLVEQMTKDFRDYGFKGEIHKIYADADKDTDLPITISTWQGIHKLPKQWFAKHNVIFGDEAHNFKATSLIKIMNALVNCPIRIGTTGSLDEHEQNHLTLQGLFGPIRQAITTDELVQLGFVAKPSIHCVLLKHSPEACKALAKASYDQERDYLIAHPRRNALICDIAKSLPGNVLVMYRMVEKHGKILHKMLEGSDRPVLFVHGKTETEVREQIRQGVKKDGNTIIVASEGTFSTGINMPYINDIVLASPTKSRIKVLQTIGRGLRKADGKTTLRVFDIADDLTHKKWVNHTLKHFAIRMKIYINERFEYTIKRFNIK